MKPGLLNTAMNAAKIGLQMTEDGSSTAQADWVANSALTLDQIEAQQGFKWEEQQTDWETVCSKIGNHIAANSRAATYEEITGFMKGN